MRLLILVAVALASAGAVELEVASHWSGGFNAKACIPITTELHGWEVEIHFDQPVSSIDVWKADIKETKDEGKTYVLSNKEWNKDEHVGDTLCIDFLGHTSTDYNPTGSAVVVGVPDSGPAQTTSSPNHTPANTHAHGHSTAQHVTANPAVTYARDTTIHSAGVTVAPPAGGGKATATMHVLTDWGDRFEAEFTFPLTEDVMGWMMNITFNEPVTKMDLPTADPYSKSPDGLVWTIVNKQDRPFYNKGEEMKMRFFANHQGHDKPEATAVLINLGLDNADFLHVPRKTDKTKYNYDEVLYKSILFYEAQRSGKLPKSKRIPWRGDSALGDKGNDGEDLTGGWYDAGDHVKFGFPMAYTATVLSWGLLTFKDAYLASGQLDFMYDCVKWPLDYLLKAHVAKDKLYVQVGDGGSDHSFWGRPEDMTMARPAYYVDPSKPGCDVAGETAAAFAAGYLAFKDKDPAYAAKLLSHAKDLYEFANSHQGKYSTSVPAAAQFYASFNYTDELAWMGLWLYKATKQQKYLDDAKTHFDPDPAWGTSWDEKNGPVQVLLYNLTGEAQYKAAVEGTFKMWMPGGTIPYTPKGLAWRLQWASLRYASNMAMVALMAAESGINPEAYRKWAMSQIHYALGDTGFSYLVGFGDKYPHMPHHRGASCPYPPAPCGPFFMGGHQPNVHVLYGALVGGPGANDDYTDERSNYVSNEVACDYNAGFQTAVAGLKSLYLRGLHPEQTSSP